MRAKELAELIEKEAKGEEEIRLMHLCGTHEDTITKYALRSFLPENVKLLSGPGCPVCITPDVDLQKVFHLIEKRDDIVLTTFGDMARVPYMGKSLLSFRGKRDIRIVYSIFDAVKIAKKGKKVVHFGIGFETTMPSTALAILDKPENFYVFSSHRYFIPAMDYLLSLGDLKIDGLINPGHVSTIVGVKAYEPLVKKYKIPQVIAGFEPLDVLTAIFILVKIIKAIRSGEKPENLLFNEYKRAVSYEGNIKAQKIMSYVFDRDDWEWRGLGVIPNSGAIIKDNHAEFDACKVFEDVFEDFEPKIDPKKKACRCGDVLRGLITPEKCPLFMKSCTPKDPVGPCMVSYEGTCSIWAKYGGYRI